MSVARPFPIREAELWQVWLSEAARLGLHAGEREELAELLIGWRPPFTPAVVRDVLSERIRLARRRRPRYVLDGSTIRTDPLGTNDNLGDLLAELRYRAAGAHRAAVLADLATGRRAADVAREWDITTRTLRRWRQADKITRPVSAEVRQTGRSVAA